MKSMIKKPSNGYKKPNLSNLKPGGDAEFKSIMRDTDMCYRKKTKGKAMNSESSKGGWNAY